MPAEVFRLAGSVRLKRGREAALRRRHPWVYRGALAGPLPDSSGPVAVRASDGSRVGVALAGGSGGSLALRMVAFGEESWGVEVLRKRLADAVALRERLAPDSDAFRVVHAEGDHLPGLVVDTYGSWLVVEPYEPAWEPYLGEIVAALASRLDSAGALLRPAWEHSRPARTLRGGEPPRPLVIREGPLRFPVDVVGGQKTGFFLDQRDNRRRFAPLASGCDLLNLFSYSGGFAVAARAAGAHRTVNVDASTAALDLARQAYELNHLPLHDDELICGDAFQVTRELLAGGASFQTVVVDPPGFVKKQRDRQRGLAGYRDINLQALRLLAAGGLLLTCSCSALVSPDDLGAVLAAAALDARREVRVLARWGAAPDHPVSLTCPESRHLQAWLCAVS